MSDDNLPSIRSPSSWETPGRNRQLTSPQQLYVRNSDESSCSRMSSPSSWRPIANRDSTATSQSNCRRQILEAELRMCKEELERRNDLIAQLTSLETPRPRIFSLEQNEDVGCGSAEDLATVRKSATLLQVKVDGLLSQIDDLNQQVESRNERITELTSAMKISAETSAKQCALITTLRERINDIEKERSDLEGTASRQELALATLQKECHDAQQRIIDLEMQLRNHEDQLKQSEQLKGSINGQFTDLVYKLNGILGLSCDDASLSADHVIGKIKELKADRSSCQLEIESLRHRMESLQLEQQKDHQAIAHLTAERDKLNESVIKHIDEMRKLQEERASSEAKLHHLQHDTEELRRQADESDRAHIRAEVEWKERESQIAVLKNEIHDWKAAVEHEKTHLKSFIKSVVAQLEIDASSNVSEDGSCVVERVRNIVRLLRDKSAKVELLEQKIEDLSGQLRSVHNQPSVNTDALAQLERRLQRAEEELAAGDVLRDNLRADREKFLRFMERLSQTLAMDAISADVGMDDLTIAVLTRAEQVMKSEAAVLAERKSQVYNLQRKLKVLKDQLDSKDVHLELLRKKNVSLEERLSNKTEIEREKDVESVRSRKLMKLAEKYKRELNEAHAEMRDLRARLLHTSEIQAVNIELKRENERLQSELSHLEGIRQNQAVAIGSLQESIGSSSQEQSRKQDQASNTITALTSELRTTKLALEDVTKRERQLVDLRDVIARMLGLAVNTLAVPDYEVIARLEQLILANQTNAATAFALDSALVDLGDNFCAGYREASRRLAVGLQTRPAVTPGVHHRRKVEGGGVM